MLLRQFQALVCILLYYEHDWQASMFQILLLISRRITIPRGQISLVCSPAILGVLAGAGISQIREILPYDDSPGGIADLCLPKTSGILLAHITDLWARVDRGPCVDLRMFHDYSFKALLISVLSKSLSDPSSLLRLFH